MWNKRAEEPEPARAPEEIAPVPREQRPAPAQGAAVIGKQMRIRGEIHSGEDLLVDGQVEGALDLPGHRLTVGPGGEVQADIRAREVVIQGNVKGNVEAREKVTIRKDARLSGDLRMAGIQIEDGAYFKGSIDIIRPDSGASPRGEGPSGAPSARQAPGAGTAPGPPQPGARK